MNVTSDVKTLLKTVELLQLQLLDWETQAEKDFSYVEDVTHRAHKTHEAFMTLRRQHEAAQADVVVLKDALLRLVDAARHASTNPQLGSALVNAHYALIVADQNLDNGSLVAAAAKALALLELHPEGAETEIAALQMALRKPSMP